MKFTIFGASGFVGDALSRHLRIHGHHVCTPTRGAEINLRGNLGHVVYCIGVTADFRRRPFDTAEAHVGLLADLLRSSDFESWLYLSSTRVYGRTKKDSVDETTPIIVGADADGLYDLSKLTGEALCHAQWLPTMRVARLSNVYGLGQSTETFLGSLIADLSQGRNLEIREAPTSSKDYVALADVCSLLEHIALEGRETLYNVASGISLTHEELGAALSVATGRNVGFSSQALRRDFPRIDITRIAGEFNFHPRRLIDDLDDLVGTALANRNPE